MADDQPEELPPPPVTVTKPGLFARLGGRTAGRPAPRFGVGLAGAGAAMGVLGAVLIGGDQLAGTNGGGSRQIPGMLITLGVIVLGVILTARWHDGPFAAAGVAASAIAVVPFFVFATYSSGSVPPVATILFLSWVSWAAGYVVAPGRGHPVYLAAALVGLWTWVIEATQHVSSLPAFAVGSALDPTERLGLRAAPDLTAIGNYSLAFALVYLVAGRLFDGNGKHGVATPLMGTGIVILIVGIVALSPDLEQVGTGVALWLAGLVLLLLGATQGRRGTNWIGAILVFIGVSVVLEKPFDTATALGFAELWAAAVVVLLAAITSVQFREPSELDPIPSRFYSGGSVQPSGPPPPPAGSVLG